VLWEFELYNCMPKKLISLIKRLCQKPCSKCKRNLALLHGFFSLKARMNKEFEDVDRVEFVSNINMIDKKLG